MIGKIKRVPLREVWRHEARDFTTWLQVNIDILGDAIDMELSNVEREQSTGNFNVDLVAEDASGDTVIIENQLQKSDHDHLGKLITYLAASEAKAAVWIVAEARAEHVAAVSWLNQSPQNNFYIVKLEAIKIESSDPAALLTLIVGPSEEGKQIGRSKGEHAERHDLRYSFWTQLLDRAKDKTHLHSGISANHYNWIGQSAGRNGISYNYSIRQNDTKVELYIDLGKDTEEENRKIFNQFLEKKEQIEEVFEGLLGWDDMEGRRAYRIFNNITDGGYRAPEEKWPKIHDAMIEQMMRLDKALTPHVKSLK